MRSPDDVRVCSICGGEIEPGDVAIQSHGWPRHWDCTDVTGAPV